MKARRRLTKVEKAERRQASKLVDDCYAEFAERLTCLGCGKPFKAPNETRHYCGGACALRAIEQRERARQAGVVID